MIHCDQPLRSLQIRGRNPITVTDVCFVQVLRFLLTRGNKCSAVKLVSVSDMLYPISRIHVRQLWPRRHWRKPISLD